MYIAKLIIDGNDDPPRRLLEEAIEHYLFERGEEVLNVAIEFVELKND